MTAVRKRYIIMAFETGISMDWMARKRGYSISHIEAVIRRELIRRTKKRKRT